MNNLNTRVWIGIVLSVIGVLMVLDNFDFFFFDINPLIFSWRTVFVIIGVVLINKNSKSIWGYVFLGIGVVGLLRHMPFIPFAHFLNFGDLWPIIILLTGIWLIFTYNKSNTNKSSNSTFNYDNMNSNTNSNTNTNTNTNANFNQGFDASNNSNFSFASSSTSSTPFDFINEDVLLNNAYRVITSQNFKGGKINSVLSSTKIDLTGAKLAPGEQILEINAVFGGIQIRVPHTWKVIISVSSVFGGFDDKRFIASEQINQDSVLIIKGGVVFGGGEVLN